MAEKPLKPTAEPRPATQPQSSPVCFGAYEGEDNEVMSGLTLSIEDERKMVNPSAKQIGEAIRSVSPVDGPFFILEKNGDDLTFMQALLEDDPWVVEYQEGSLKHHFLATKKYTTEEVIGLFLVYAKGNETWRTSESWGPLKL